MRLRGRACETCGRGIPEPLTRCRRRTCPSYSALWAGDQRRKLFVNLDGYAEAAPVDRSAAVLMSAVTAPGAGELPWSDDCAALGLHRHSGLLGCRVDSGAAAAWNRSAPSRWTALHRRVYTLCARSGRKPALLSRVWEMQHRGVLHVHPVLGFTTAAERLAARLYLRHLVELAPAFGFGFVERKERPMAARAAAAYLSAYFVTGSKTKTTLQESVMHRGMPRSIVHVSSALTMRTGCTMRRLRLARFIYYRWGHGALCVGDTWHVLDRYATSDKGVILRRQKEPDAST